MKNKKGRHIFDRACHDIILRWWYSWFWFILREIGAGLLQYRCRQGWGTLKIIDEKIAYFNGGSYTGEELKFWFSPPDGNKWFLVSFFKAKFFPWKAVV